MKPEWKRFLLDRGAELDADERVLHYGNPDLELRVVTSGDVICDLSHFGLLAAHGEDARDFLQAQLTNDLRRVDEGRSQLSAYCTPKGRMLAVFRLFLREAHFYLEMPRALVEPTLGRLRKYVLRAKVSLEDASDALVRMGLSGPNAERELGEVLGTAPPTEADGVVHADGLTVIRIPGPHPRFELHGDLEAVQRAWTRLDVRAAPVGAEPWTLLDILAGIPTVLPETVEAFVPQMANLHAVGGLSFEKGCYPGQEVVARMQYLGKLKRRMYRFHVDGDAPSEPGMDIYAPGGGTPDQSVGKVVAAAPWPDGGRELLAVVQIASAEAGGLRLGAPDGPALEPRELPYPFPAQKAG